MFQLECTGHIATINYEPQWERRPEPPQSKPHQGNLRHRLTRQQWAAYLRACGKIKRSEQEDMAPQGMVPFGRYDR